MGQENGAIYCRLSQDDGSAGESGSMQTQKTLLTQYCKEHSIHVAITTVTMAGVGRILTVRSSNGCWRT